MKTMQFRAVLVLLSAIFTMTALAAGNVRYKWRDVEGNLHYTDSLPADAGVRGYEVISAQGIVVKRVEPAKTPEQKTEAKLAAEAARAEKAAAERRQRADQQLLAANPTENDLKETQRQQIAMIDQQIGGLQTGLESLEKSLTDLLGRAAELERSDRTVPPRLVSQIADMRKKIEGQHAAIGRRHAERATVVQEFVVELDHYRALREKYNQH